MRFSERSEKHSTKRLGRNNVLMKLIETSLTHKLLYPQVSQREKCPTVILLHGRGANEDDLLGLSEYLDDRFLFISVRAPFNFQYGGGYTWYDILELGKAEPKMFAESYRRLVHPHSFSPIRNPALPPAAHRPLFPGTKRGFRRKPVPPSPTGHCRHIYTS